MKVENTQTFTSQTEKETQQTHWRQKKSHIYTEVACAEFNAVINPIITHMGCIG